jgi:hypothetical protein
MAINVVTFENRLRPGLVSFVFGRKNLVPRLCPAFSEGFFTSHGRGSAFGKEILRHTAVARFFGRIFHVKRAWHDFAEGFFTSNGRGTLLGKEILPQTAVSLKKGPLFTAKPLQPTANRSKLKLKLKTN